jgi:AcrR family transcriptional regulator
LPANSLASQLREQRSEIIGREVETAALSLFDARGFGELTVEEIATEAGISVRTFYRYFTGKEEVLQRRIDRRSDALRAALVARPSDEAPLQSLRIALVTVQATEDDAMARRWIAVIIANPSVVKGVLGEIQLKRQAVLQEFFASRLGTTSDSLAATMLAAAVGGVIQAAHSRWFFHGGDLGETIASGLRVLERGISPDSTAWTEELDHELWGTS